MKLHVFNPEHDLALAFGSKYFTSPHAGRQLRSDLGFLPALWAEDGDVVLVDDVPNALAQVRHLKAKTADVLYMTQDDLRRSSFTASCCPWGWDAAIKHQLKAFETPTDEQIEAIRNISHRKWAAEHLGNPGIYCTDVETVVALVEKWLQVVLKAPWSSSGRGVRYWDSSIEASSELSLKKWAESIIKKQGGIMVEPYYKKVKDFGMEFYAHCDGTVTYEGLSLFETVNGAYTGNLLASEREKMQLLTKYVREEKLLAIQAHIIKVMAPALHHVYTGPFGVDMMIIKGGKTSEQVVQDEFDVQSCVELNLRRTMGHVAIAATRRLNPDGTAPHQLMRIEYDGSHYHFRILNTQTNALNTSLMR